MGFFDIEIGQPELSEAEQLIQSFQIEGLTQERIERLGLGSALLATIGYTQDTDGTFRQLSSQERFDRMSPLEQQNYRNLESLVERQRAAIAGETPISEALKQSKETGFQGLQETASRRGQPIVGSTPESAFGLSTVAARNLGEFNRTFGLREDVERRHEIETGSQNIAQGFGILSGMDTNKINRLTSFPLRNVAATTDVFNQQQGILANRATNEASLSQGLIGDIIGGGSGILEELIRLIP